MVVQDRLRVDTRGRGTYDITRDIAGLVAAAGVDRGLCNVFLQHTSASLMLCENADPDVRRDLESFMGGLVRDGDPAFVHTQEGPDDMAAHVRTVLTQSDITVPVAGGALQLGTWQGVYLWEHRIAPHRRTVLVTLYGER